MKTPVVHLTISAIGLCLLCVRPMWGSPCALLGNNSTPTIVFRAEKLPRELSGFFPYIPSTQVPMPKYRTETWRGANGHHAGAGGGSSHDITNLVNVGSWSFSATDFTDTSMKELHGVSNTYGPTPYDLLAVKLGIDEIPPNLDQGYGVVSGPVATLDIQSATKRQIVWSGPLNAYSGWLEADLHEELSDPFPMQSAIDRAEAKKTAVAGESLQYWNDYSPKTPSQIQSRTEPVKFHAQRVSFRLNISVCPGEYVLVTDYKIWAQGGAEPTTKTKTFAKKITVYDNQPFWPATIDGVEAWENYAVELKQGEQSKLVAVRLISPCEAAEAGTSWTELHSVEIAVSLGRVDANHSAGMIILRSETITTETFSPAMLAVVDDPSVAVLKTAAGVIRQVKAPELLVDVIVLSADAYELRLYRSAQVGVLETATNLYPVSGPPFKTYTVANPNPGVSTNSLRFSDDIRDPIVYTYDASTRVTAMSQLGGARVETVTKSANGLTEERLIKDAQGAVVDRQVDTYVESANGRLLVESLHGINPSGYSSTSYTYGAGRVTKETAQSGAWTTYGYDSAGRILSRSSSSGRTSVSAYATIPDQDGDGIAEELDTTVETLSGREISRTFELRYSATSNFNNVPTKRIHSIQAVSPGASWDAGDNLVTVRREIAAGPFLKKEAFAQTPDGVLRLTTYSYSDGTLTTSRKVGAPNPDRTSVVDGTLTTTVTSAAGYAVSATVVDIASGITLEQEVTTQTDDFGRPTRIDYLDGTHALRSYACCGLASETDRHGTVTLYNYDGIGRLTTTTQNGLSTILTLDAAGRTLAVKRRGSDGSEVTLETNTYDSSGYRKSTRDALNRQTLFALTPNAGTGNSYITTTTAPDGGTKVEFFANDALRFLSGTGVSLRQITPGADANGLFSKEEFQSVPFDPLADYENIPPPTEWVTHYSDLVGRSSFDLYPNGARFDRFYNLQGQLVRTVDPDGVQMLYAYNAKGEQTTAAIDLNRNGVIDYSGSDRITRTSSAIATRPVATGTIPVRRTVTETWDTSGADTPTIVSISESSLDGRQTWQTAAGLTTATTTVNDGSGGRIETTTMPDGGTQIRTYVAGRLITTTTKDSAGATLSSTTFGYDPHGRLQTQSVAGIGATTYTYFDDDQVRTITTPDPDPQRTGPGYDPQTTTYAYDSAGRVAVVTQPDGTAVNTTYYPTGKVKRTWGSRTYPVEYTYDWQGRVTTLTTWRDFAGDAGKAVTKWTYDPLRGWLTAKQDADNKGATYDYWPSGRLKLRTWARQAAAQPLTTSYTYNSAGDLALTDYSDATPDVTLTYDRRGRVVSTTDAAGTVTLSYHAAGPVQSETYGPGLLAGQSVSRSFDALNRLSTLGVGGQSVATSYSYDAASRLQGIVVGPSATTYSYLQNSGLVGTVNSRQNGSALLTTTKSYDAIGRLSSVSHAAGAITRSHAYTYDAANQRTQVKREDAGTWDYTYDSLGQVTAALKHRADGAPRLGQNFAFSYDDIGNRRTASLNAQTSTYVADTLNRYTSRTVPSVVPVLGRAAADATVQVNHAAPTRQDDWFYTEIAAPNGSGPQSVTLDIGGVQTTATPEIAAYARRTAFLPQSPESFTYDADGNLLQDGRWTYTWDAENRLSALETRADVAGLFPALRLRLEFAYDAAGRRLRKQVKTWSGSAWSANSDRRFLYDGWNLIGEFEANLATSALTLVRTYTWGLDLSSSLQDAGGVGGLLWTTAGALPHAFATDGNGNVIASFNSASGALTHESDFGPFGEPIPLASARPGAFGFSSKYSDPETGLVYYGRRYYNPNTGRWLSRDPIGENGGVNLYGFVDNAPTEWIDPLGLALYAFDGTNNDGYRDAPNHEETNVFILFGAYDGFKAYVPGVGTNDGILNPLGSAFGLGGQARITDMLGKAGEFVQKGDLVADILGFSRGAAQARAFANKLKEKYPCVRIRWIGLFDTVASEGLPNDVNIGYKLGIPKDTGSVFHLTAGGERRARTFALTSINPGPNQSNPNSNYRESEVPDAAHSDVGGGYGSNRGLANFSLLLMWQNGRASDVPFGPLPSKYSNYVGTPHDSRWNNDKLVEFLTGRQRVRKIYYHP